MELVRHSSMWCLEGMINLHTSSTQIGSPGWNVDLWLHLLWWGMVSNSLGVVCKHFSDFAGIDMNNLIVNGLLVYSALPLAERRCFRRLLPLPWFGVAMKFPLFISSSEKSTLSSWWPLKGKACFAKNSTAKTIWQRMCLLASTCCSLSFISLEFTLSLSYWNCLEKGLLCQMQGNASKFAHGTQEYHPYLVLWSMASGREIKLKHLIYYQLLNYSLWLAISGKGCNT